MSKLTLHNLQAPKGLTSKTKKRRGRGNSSGLGTYAGRGIKGQKSRSGVSGLKLKGLRRRLLSIPKLRGFTSLRKKRATVSVADLENHYDADGTVTAKSLIKKGLIDTPRFGVKILGEGKISKPLTIRKVSVSESAKAKIEKAGGKIE